MNISSTQKLLPCFLCIQFDENTLKLVADLVVAHYIQCITIMYMESTSVYFDFQFTLSGTRAHLSTASWLLHIILPAPDPQCAQEMNHHTHLKLELTG